MGKNEDVSAAIAAGCVAFVLTVSISFWLLMLLWGSVAPIFGWPTLSFGESVLLGLLASSLGGFFNSGTTFASTLGRK